MTEAKVAIIGLGTVGSGVAKILLDQSERVSRHAGRPLNLAKVVVRDLEKTRDCQLPSGVITTNISEIIEDPEIKVVAQLMGGLEPARTIMLKLLQSGKDIVTANKALLAEHGAELFECARSLGRSIAFEASVAGGVPIITNISQCLSANQILSLRGILNGTSNFIVSQMEEHGADYAGAVEEAQRLGFAEADPTMDVDGTDAAQKLAILAHLAFGAAVKWPEIPCTGIDVLNPIDLGWARDLGYRIKLLAVAKLSDGALELHVSPTLVKLGTPLAEVRGANNAISVVGDMVGRVFYHGLGAGQLPTASAVVADMIDTAVGRTPITFRTLELWSQSKPRVPLADHAAVNGRFYLRFTVEDHPGVLADVAGVLGKNEISIASVIQREIDNATEASDDVSLVIMTHTASEGKAAAAVSEIDNLPSVRAGSVRMRVLD
ncbi:MAG: homoserine dehydrogenase [Planctomycetaceae bacterium]|nr:homoserine dehydrogenase [Planctomycetaceae bacterium]